jgi:hypothetical protein
MLGNSGYERPPLDAYWTEPWVTEWLLDAVDLGDRIVWESACGTGTMARVLLEREYVVLATDLADYGYLGLTGLCDFFAVDEVDPAIGAIVTNPPYSHAEVFIRHGLRLMAQVQGMVCMLLRNEYDCAASRRDLFNGFPFAAKYVLTRRPRWATEHKASPRHNYAWYVWDHTHVGAPTFRLLPAG